MDRHSINLDLASALAAPRACPACGLGKLRSGCDDQGVTFTCLSCQRCWSLELGMMAPVGPERFPVSPRRGAP